RCRGDAKCRAFQVNYLEDSCTSLQADSRARGASLNHTEQPINYFEKICLNVPPCSKEWMLERVEGFEVDGYDDIVRENIQTRQKCAELCVSEKNLPCRSAEYHERDFVCRLSRQDRRTKPLNFRATNKVVSYIENQCAPGAEASIRCPYEELQGRDVNHSDLQLSVRSKE
ncbi:unnamed protein product, partial [Meganyctiphanes norvegica]